MHKIQVVWHHFTTTTSRRMKAIILAMSGLLALANAAPHPDNSYSNCKVEYRPVKKTGYEEVIEQKEKIIYINVCEDVYQTECINVKVCTYLLILLVFESS